MGLTPNVGGRQFAAWCRRFSLFVRGGILLKQLNGGWLRKIRPGGQMQVGWVKIGDFRQITGYIWKTVQDRRMISIKSNSLSNGGIGHDLECPLTTSFSAFCTIVHSFATGDFKFGTGLRNFTRLPTTEIVWRAVSVDNGCVRRQRALPTGRR